MRIGLIDVDSHRFVNLPLMKLSAWHKQQGDSMIERSKETNKDKRRLPHMSRCELYEKGDFKTRYENNFTKRVRG